MRSFKLKIIISVYVCLVVLAFYNSFHSYQNNIKSAKASVFAKLSAIAGVIGSQIDGDQHQRIISTYLKKDGINTVSQDPDYLKVQQQLAAIKRTAKIKSDIYTLFPTKDFKKFYFGVSSNNTPYFRHLFHTPPSQLIKNYFTGGNIDEYKDENGIWLSSFAPIKNSKNEIIAVVQIDKNFAEFKEDIIQDLIYSMSLIICFYSLIGFLLYVFLKGVLGKEEGYVRSKEEYMEILANEVSLRTVELSIANAKLLKLNKELESFFYSTSHDIRGPLCRILGLSSLAKIETDKQQLVEMIEVESQKMDEMLKKMIVVNNIRTKDLKIEELNVSESVSLVLSGLRAKYKFIKEDISFTLKNDQYNRFSSDAELFECIVVNLFDNAFKFSDQKNPVIKINSFIDDNGIFSISVTNNGKLFSDIERDNAFELFKRANKAGDMETLRLGLYAIKTSLDRLNGIIDIYTENGQSEIRIMIPDFNINEKVGATLKTDLAS